MKEIIGENVFYNTDCIEGSRQNIGDDSVDLIITDPPYGIEGDKLHRHYNRKEEFVADGYVEVPKKQYNSFSRSWIKEAERILRPNGQIYIVSGYTNLYDVLDGLRQTSLNEINHIIWKYNFGVYTKRKFVSSHYHILYYEKPGPGKRTFNAECRFGAEERTENDRSLNYLDREDVWVINRQYKPGQVKNKNELPTELLMKMIQYSSNKEDVVCDMFMGGFSTARVAIGMGRRFVGFELSGEIFRDKIREMESVKKGHLLSKIREPEKVTLPNRGKKWTEDERRRFKEAYYKYSMKARTKKELIELLSGELGRGRFSIRKMIDSIDKGH